VPLFSPIPGHLVTMIASRVQPRCQSFMSRLFLQRPSVAADSAHFEEVLRRFGLIDVLVVKTRRDTKVIARGTHPEWGTVAIKVIDPIASPEMAYKGHHADGIVAANPASILPRIHVFGLGYSVSEWIEGEQTRIVGHAQFHSMPLIGLADELATWGARFATGTLLGETAVLATLRFYVGVTIRRMGYRSAAKCVSACARFVADRKRLGEFLDNMARLAPRLRLKRTLMLSDLHPGNVIYSKEADRLVYVDHEPLRPGNYIFDIVFFLSFLMVTGAPREVTDRLARHVFSEAYMQCPAAVPFFRDFASYIVATYMTIDGHDQNAIEVNLDALRTAGA
jgi:hypothetical protein